MAIRHKAVILAGGQGTRLAEITENIPKPMVRVGGQPVLWHIMKGFAQAGVSEFVVALGHKGEVVRDFFAKYRFNRSSMSIKLRSGRVEVHDDKAGEDWTVHLLETGPETDTGGRLKRVMEFVGREPILATYGDGVADVDIPKLLAFHKKHGKAATVTAVRPPARFGGLELEGPLVSRFVEKPQIGEGWINGGFFVLEPRVRSFIEGDSTSFERDALERLAREGQLAAYRHESFWQCMDTVRDHRLLEDLWARGRAPWKTWD